MNIKLKLAATLALATTTLSAMDFSGMDFSAMSFAPKTTAIGGGLADAEPAPALAFKPRAKKPVDVDHTGYIKEDDIRAMTAAGFHREDALDALGYAKKTEYAGHVAPEAIGDLTDPAHTHATRAFVESALAAIAAERDAAQLQAMELTGLTHQLNSQRATAVSTIMNLAGHDEQTTKTTLTNLGDHLSASAKIGAILDEDVAPITAAVTALLTPLDDILARVKTMIQTRRDANVVVAAAAKASGIDPRGKTIAVIIAEVDAWKAAATTAGDREGLVDNTALSAALKTLGYAAA